MAEKRAEDLTWTDERLWPQFAQQAEWDPLGLAVVDCAGRHWTRAELRALADRYAAELAAHGVGKADRVLVRAAKTVPTLAVALAVSALEAAVCPYSPKIGPAELAALEETLGHAAKVEASADGEIAIAPTDPAERSRDPRNQRLALIGFTSGSTGVPKAVMHAPEALNYATRACARIAGLAHGDAILGIVPLESAPGFTFTAHFALSLGHPLVWHDPWDPAEALSLAERYGCAWAIMVPTHLYTMVEAARLGRWKGRNALRTAAVGGSAMTPELIAEAESLLGLQALRMFGMSECMGHCSARITDTLERRQNYDGLPFPGTQEEAFGPDLKPLPRGARGQAGVRGPSLFIGYAEGLGQGQEQLAEGGYYLTGDEIVRDDAGYVKVVGRIKDQIIRGGFNLDPAEIEAAILRNPAIAEVAVVPVPHAKLGEQACAVCRLAPGAEMIDLAALVGHLEAEGLSRKKWPELLVIVEHMPVTATGKLDKKALAAAALGALSPAPALT
ncbi:MAG: acyl--CoA ligase [Erythrobacter sp.]|uniref:class I adenylate-forming enzyme family protein n=1 Tax=Erythrobacter sp. TaxID=1042 RepID=UPI0025E3FCCE|nr:class I adenylate-forming enzyme family protein [Erythrobacter sp.]MCL9998798.1 acyl--CoA ligase [Erythrobacter sp.]